MSMGLLIDEQKMSVIVLNEILDVLELTVEKVVMRLKNSKTSRLIYVGAGTSGIIGGQDGGELYPTFGWPFKRLYFIKRGYYQCYSWNHLLGAKLFVEHHVLMK